MVIQVLEQDLSLFYRRAKESYLECVSNPENVFLQDEVQVPATAIELREITVKVVFEFRNASAYLLEVFLALHANGKAIGRYECMMDKEGTVFEDNLVFY